MKDFLLSEADRDPDFRAAVNAVDLTGEDADTFFDALGSETSRAIFELLYEEPRTPTELAEAIDSSRQNVHYHLRKLAAADLVHSVDTVYSSRGTEVDVYAPTSEAVVLLTGQASTVDRVKEVLSRFVGGLAVLLLATLLLQAAVAGGVDVDLGLGGGAPAADGPAAGGAPASTTPVPGSTGTPEPAAQPRASGGGDGTNLESTPAATGTSAPSGEATGVDDEQLSVTRENGSNDTVGFTAKNVTLTTTPALTATPQPTPTTTPRATTSPQLTPAPTTAPAGGPSNAPGPAVFFLAGGVVALAVSAVWQLRRP